MTTHQPSSAFLEVLRPEETLIWRGCIGFNFSTSPVVLIGLGIISAITFRMTWSMYSYDEFCPAEKHYRKCGSFYYLVPLLMPLLLITIGFASLERLAFVTGKARGVILLTDQRLIRVSDWPWQRIWSRSYREIQPRRGIGGVITFDRTHSVILSPDDADHVMRLIDEQLVIHP